MTKRARLHHGDSVLIREAAGAHAGTAWPLATTGGIALICVGSAVPQFPKQSLSAILGNVARSGTSITGHTPFRYSAFSSSAHFGGMSAEPES
jgi:hypothetical protein